MTTGIGKLPTWSREVLRNPALRNSRRLSPKLQAPFPQGRDPPQLTTPPSQLFGGKVRRRGFGQNLQI